MNADTDYARAMDERYARVANHLDKLGKKRGTGTQRARGAR